MRVRVPPRAARRHEYVTARRHEYVTAHRTQVQVFDEKRGKMRAEDITGGITADGYDAPRARFDDQVCFDFMKGRCGIRRLFLSRSRGLMDKASPS